MDTRKYESPLGGDIGTSKATKGRGWKGLRGQMALALAVSLWIGSSGFASADGLLYLDNNDALHQSGERPAGATVSNSGKTLTITGGASWDSWVFNGGLADSSAVEGYTLKLSNVQGTFSAEGGNTNTADAFGNTVEGININTTKTIRGAISHNGNAYNNNVVLKNSTVSDDVLGGEGDCATNNSVTLESTTAKNVYGGFARASGKKAEANEVTISGGEVSGHVYGGYSDSGQATNNKVTISGGGVVRGLVCGGETRGSMENATGNEVTINSGTVLLDVYGGDAQFGGAAHNHVIIKGKVSGKVYGGRSSNPSDGGWNKVEILGGTVDSDVYGDFKNSFNNTVVLHDATVGGSVCGDAELLDDTGNTLILSGSSTVNDSVNNFETIEFDGEKFSWDTTKTVLTANQFSNPDCTLDVTALVNKTGTGTMTLLSSGRENDFKTLKLAYNTATQATPVTMDSSKTSQVVKAGTTKTSEDKGITIAYNENEHTVSLDAANSYKNVNYTIANDINKITLGEINWVSGGTVRSGTGYAINSNYSTGREIDVSNFKLKFANETAYNSMYDQTMTLIDGLTFLGGGVDGSHTQSLDYTVSNGANITTNITTHIFNTGNKVNCHINWVGVRNIDLKKWDSTQGAFVVPDNWKRWGNWGGNPVTVAADFTTPNITPGTIKEIVDATKYGANFFSDANISGTQKYSDTLVAASNTVNGVTLSGAQVGGVKADDSGKKLVYVAGDFNVNKISLGAMAWGTPRGASAAGYDYSNAAVNMDGLTFSNPADIAATSSTTLLTANNTLGEIAEKTKNISYGYSPVDGVTVNGIINGSYKATGGEISYTATGNNATKLTFGNVAWTGGDENTPGTPLMTRPNNITFAGADVDTTNINFTNIKELEAHKQMTLVSNFGDTVGTITGTKYKVGSTLQGEGKASLVDSNYDGTMDALIFTTDTRAEKMTAQEQTHNTVMGAEVGMAALSAGNDFVGAATEGLAMAGNTGADGMATYANMGGGSMNVETGSHVKTHTWNAILALGHKNEKKLSTTEYGAFFEYGTGNYSTFNGDERGDGSTRYTGGGILGKWQKNNGFYVEGSLRAGSIHDDATNVLRDVNGNPYSYDTDATYWGAHIGVGREIKLNKTAVLDLYAKYFYNHRGSVSFDAGGHYDLGAVESSVLRVGTRYTVKQNDNINYYGGLAVEHEFCGRASGFADGVAIRGADISGTSVRGEIGATFRPGEKSNVTLDLNLSGFAGKKQGLTGGLSAVFHI